MQSWKTTTSRVMAGALMTAVLAAACSKDEKPSEDKAAPVVAPATAAPLATATASAPVVAAPAAPAAPAKPHKTCPAKQTLAKVADAEECLLQCKTQADCPNKTFCTSGVLVDPPGEHAKLCFKVD